MKLKLLIGILSVCAILAAPPAPAQFINAPSYFAVYRYDLDATTETFCVLARDVVQVSDRVTDSTSTTMTAVSGSPFANVSAGDMIFGFDNQAGGGEGYTKAVLARASATSITLNSPVSPEVNPTLTSATLSFRKLTCGTGSTNGIIDVSAYRSVVFQVDIVQLNATGGIDSRIQCRSSPDALWWQVYPAITPGTTSASYVSSTAVGAWAVEVSGAYAQCRVGMLIHTADDGGDTGANAEQISVSVRGRN